MTQRGVALRHAQKRRQDRRTPKWVVLAIVVGVLGSAAWGEEPAARWTEKRAADPAPSALPSLFTGLRISAVYAVIGAIFGEYVGATDGLGIWMRVSQNSFRTDLVFGAILLTAIVSVALYLGVGIVERAVVPWSPAARGRSVEASEPSH